MGPSTNAALDPGPFGTDRIDVMDEAGIRIGSIDPRTGARNLLLPERAAEFDEMVEYWLSAAGLSSPAEGDKPVETRSLLKVNEVRYPDADVIRSLLIPLILLGSQPG